MVGFYTVPTPPPPPPPFFFPCLLFLLFLPSLPPSFSNSLPFLSTDSSISSSGFRFFCCCFLCVCVCVFVFRDFSYCVISLYFCPLSYTTWSITLCLVFRLFFLVLFVSQGGFTAESLIVVFQLVELALYPYRVCVCVFCIPCSLLFPSILALSVFPT